MIAATATFAVMKYQPAPDVVRVLTILTGLDGIGPSDVFSAIVPTYDEAVRIVTERALTVEPQIGFLKKFGVAEYVVVSERILFRSIEELNGLATAMD